MDVISRLGGLLVVVLAAAGSICFLLTIICGWREPFSIDRTATTLGGGNRTQLSKPMVFAIGALLCFGLAALLMLYSTHAGSLAAIQPDATH
jgi:hypothetical protein